MSLKTFISLIELWMIKEDSGHEVISSIHPPASTVFVAAKAKAIPFKMEFDKESAKKHLEIMAATQMIEQNNYTNLFLQSLGLKRQA